MTEAQFKSAFMELEKVLTKCVEEKIDRELHGVVRQVVYGEMRDAISGEIRKMVRERLELQVTAHLKDV